VVAPSLLVQPVTQQQIQDVQQLEFPAQGDIAMVMPAGPAMEHVIYINIPFLTMQTVGRVPLQAMPYVEGALQPHLRVQEQAITLQDFP
jgi:hypothetical protein